MKIREFSSNLRSLKPAARLARLMASFALLFVVACDTNTAVLTEPAQAVEPEPVISRDFVAEVENSLRTPVSVDEESMQPMALDSRMDHYGVPGVSIAVINEGKIEWARGYGVQEVGSSTPVKASTVFQAASISKPVSAVAALKLVESGTLTLDEDVNQRLASWKIPDNEFTTDEKVSLRHIVSHGAGFTIHGFPGYAAGTEIPTVPQVLDGVEPANTEAVLVDTIPGQQWRYSGGGYTVMQLMLEDIAGQSFADILSEQVLQPFGMRNSTFEQPLPQSLVNTAASGHKQDGTVLPGKYHTYPELAAAGLWTTPSDLARVAINVQQSFHSGSATGLSADMTREMLTVQQGTYGLGFDLGGEGPTLSFSHGGGNEGFRCFLLAFAETGQGVAIMTNSDNGGNLYPEIIRAVAHVYDWPDYQQKRKQVLQMDPESLAKYTGKYELQGMPMTATVTTGTGTGSLVFEVPGAMPPLAVYPESETAFFTLAGMELEFTLDAAGEVIDVLIMGNMKAVKIEE